MSYSVRFEAKLEGTERWVPVGDDPFIKHTSNTGNMVQEVCGLRPPLWDGKKCSELLPFIDKGIKLLRSHREEYRKFEPSNGWGTVETTIIFLDAIRCVCEEYPTAVARVGF